MATEEDLRITITDVMRAGYCPSGVRSWAEGQGIDFRRFLREGIPADELLAIGGANAVRVVELKKRSEPRG